MDGKHCHRITRSHSLSGGCVQGGGRPTVMVEVDVRYDAGGGRPTAMVERRSGRTMQALVQL